MSTNRLPKEEQPDDDSTRVVATPFGIMHIHLAFPVDPNQPDPLGVAISLFQKILDESHDDPLAETLTRLKKLADEGTEQPLLAGLALLQQMSAVGALPPIEVLLENSTATLQDLERAVGSVEGPYRKKSLLERLDEDL